MAQQGAEIHLMVPAAWAPPLLARLPRFAARDHRRIELLEVAGLTSEIIPFLRPPKRCDARWGGYSLYRSLVSRVRALHAEKPIDVIYATCLLPDGDAAWRLSRTLSIPAVCLSIGTDVNVRCQTSDAMRAHFGRIVRGLSGNLACGQLLAKAIGSETQDYTPSVIGVVDTERFAPAGASERHELRSAREIEPGEILLLFVGGLLRGKGIFELAEAVSRLAERHPQMTLAVVGDGIDRPAFEEKMEELRISGRVRMVGAVDGSEVASWMKAADLLALPSYSEGMPNVVMEAMACGVPVVTTRVGGIPDELDGCEGVALVEARKTDELTAAIDRLVGDASLREEMGRVGRQVAVDRFGVQRNAQAVLGYLAAVIERERSGGS